MTELNKIQKIREEKISRISTLQLEECVGHLRAQDANVLLCRQVLFPNNMNIDSLETLGTWYRLDY